MSKEKGPLQFAPDGAPSQGSLPPLFSQVQGEAMAWLEQSLAELFNHCDDLFFDLSSRAASNGEQNLYFESMRELRVRQTAMLEHIRSLMAAECQRLISAPAEAAPPGQDELTLLSSQDLEQEVILTGMVQRTRATCREALFQLEQRLSALLARVRVHADNNPLDPLALCRYFGQACELLDVDIKARIIILKQFERLVASRLINLYSAANEQLIAAGVLPQVIHEVRPDPAAAPETDPAFEPNREALQFDFSELSNLLAGMRRLGTDRLPGYCSYTGNPGPPMNRLELIGLLTTLQLGAQLSTAMASPAPDLRQLVSELLGRNQPVSPRSLQQPDEDVINLVAMFFDFVLDDPSLPVGIQALIARLQIPILKVALRDPTFFSHSDHPARALINSIAQAGIGWDESDQPRRDRLYNTLCEVAQTVNEHYRDDPEVFSRQQRVLERLIEEEQQRSALVEKRTSQAAEGQARTVRAREAAQELLFQRLETAQVPPLVAELLSHQWQQLLTLVHLRHGEDSQEWLQSVQLVDDLLWCLGHHSDPRSQQRLARITPDLSRRIARGLELLATPEGSHVQLMERVNQLLQQLKDGSAVAMAPLTAAQRQALGHDPAARQPDLQTMTALERQQARYKALNYEYIRRAENIPLGTWLSYEDSHRGKILRCKLATRIDVSDSYVFVNRFGFKVLEKSRRDFAYDMQQGRATPLETGPLFERAMADIVDSLRNAGRPQPAPG